MLFVAKGWIWTNDLWLMRPASYQTAPPRNIVISICLRLNLCLLKKTRFKESNQLIILNFLLLRYESLNKQTHNKTLINITNFFKICIFSGGGWIRTNGPITGAEVFKTSGINHSPTPPIVWSYFQRTYISVPFDPMSITVTLRCDHIGWHFLAGPPGFEPG